MEALTLSDQGIVQRHDLPLGMSDTLTLSQALTTVLGDGHRFVSIEWLQLAVSSPIACIVAKTPEETEKKYFMKCAFGVSGQAMLEGEFRSLCEIYSAVPSLVPRPYGVGHCRQGKVEAFFLLDEFIDMSEQLPDPVSLSKSIVSLQQTSVSPTGMFGFPTTTYHGRIPQHLAWDSSWSRFFKNLLQHVLQHDLDINGPSPLLEQVSARVLEKVVPRLLGALETDGRSTRPTLIHGDLWEGNIAIEKSSGHILLFDAGAYYAHHEMEVAMWRCERHAIHDDRFRNAYLEQMPKSEPTEEWDDRNRLYCVKMNIVHSAHHRGAKERTTAFEDMCYLTEKYAPLGLVESGQEGFSELFSRAIDNAKSH